MALLADFYPYFMLQAPGCSELLADQIVRDVCIDFCSKTLIDQRTLSPMSSVANVSDYELQPPDDTRVQLVMQAWYNAQELAVVNANSSLRPEMFNSTFTGASVNTGAPRSIFQKDELTISFDATPVASEANAITLRVALKPSRAATEVADILFEDYAYEIGQGVLSRLLRMPKQAFTDPKTAADCEREYVIARNAALLRANKSLGRTSDRVMPI